MKKINTAPLLLSLFILAGCVGLSPTATLITNLAIRAGIMAVVASNPAVAPIINTVGDVFMAPQNELAPDKIRALALKEIQEADWPVNYKVLAELAIEDVMIVYTSFYDKHHQDLTDSELATVLNRIGAAMKLGASMTAVGAGQIPSVLARSGLEVTFD